ncbi:MAG: ATP-binding protein, partial [Chloroflexi bacterium]|nr:ATP-binding protein [Chloroflexota bacterium]
GIDPRFHTRIFQVFQTLQPRDDVEGSGMGLAIVKKLIETRGGTIRVESSLGQGTTFRFTWPGVLPIAARASGIPRQAH